MTKVEALFLRQGKCIIPSARDGFCFFHSALAARALQTQEKIMGAKTLAQRVLGFMRADLAHYKPFCRNMDVHQMQKEVDEYIDTGVYNKDAVDLMIRAACVYLDVNLRVYQFQDGELVSFDQDYCANPQFTLEVLFQKRYHQETGQQLGHYDAIVSLGIPSSSPPASPCSSDSSDDNMYLPGLSDDNASPQKKSSSPTRTSKQPVQESDDEVIFVGESPPQCIDLTGGELPTLHPPRRRRGSKLKFKTEEDVKPVIKKEEEGYIDVGEDEMLDDSRQVAFVHPLNRVPFNFSQFWDMEPEHVPRIPYNVNGKQLYIIKDVASHVWQELQRDGRWFDMHKTSRTGYRDCDYILRIGSCRGTYMCARTDCPYYRTSGKFNISNFHHKTPTSALCHSCGLSCPHTTCMCRKYTEYSKKEKYLKIYHVGNHTCAMRRNYKQIAHELNQIIKQDPSLGPRKAANKLMSQAMVDGDMERLDELAQQFTNIDKYKYLKKKYNVEHDDLPDDEFVTLIDLKKLLDKKDKFLIYELNARHHNNRYPFVFKSSKFAAEVMLQMDQDAEGDHPQKEEPIFFDAMHNRSQDYKTLTAWTYHAASCQLIPLCIMEVRKECKKSLMLFWQLINSMLQDVSKNPLYQFNPCCFMCDEHHANQESIKEIFGEDAVLKIVTCQMHYEHCANLRKNKIRPEDREEFLELCHDMTECETEMRYNQLFKRLLKICQDSNQGPWAKWWHKRRYHIVPAWRCPTTFKANMAEIGHAAMRYQMEGRKPISISKNTRSDVGNFIVKAAELENFLNNQAVSMGKGPNLKMKARRKRAQEKRRNKQFVEVIESGEISDILAEVNKTNSEGFMSTYPAKHRAPEDDNDTKGVQGKTFSTKRVPASKQNKRVSFQDSAQSDNEAPPLRRREVPVNFLRKIKKMELMRCWRSCKMMMMHTQRLHPHLRRKE